MRNKKGLSLLESIGVIILVVAVVFVVFAFVFKVDILRNNQKLRTLEYSGCRPDQAHEFKIYSLLNQENFLLKSTSIGDCFEGGYNVDKLYLVLGSTRSFSIPSYVYQIIIGLLIGGIAWFACKGKEI